MSTAERSPGLAWDGLELPTVAPAGDPDWFIVVRDVVGWWNGAPEVSQPIDAWSGDGQLEIEERLGTRTVEIVGSVVAKSGHLIAAQDALRQRRRGLLVVDEREMGVAKLASATRPEPVRFTHVSENLSRFSLFLRMTDPLRYGTNAYTLTNGTNYIPNDGDEDAYPTLRLGAPHNAVTIEHPDGVCQIAALAVGVWTLDFRNGDVWAGSSQTRAFDVVSGTLPVVRSGGSVWDVSGLGLGSATLTRHEAWS